MLKPLSQSPKTAMFSKMKMEVVSPSKPKRLSNKALRAREYLTIHEVEAGV
jgi:hypothetical protein